MGPQEGGNRSPTILDIQKIVVIFLNHNKGLKILSDAISHPYIKTAAEGDILPFLQQCVCDRGEGIKHMTQTIARLDSIFKNQLLTCRIHIYIVV